MAYPLASKIHDKLYGSERVMWGRYLSDLLRAEKPSAGTLAETYLVLDNSAKFQTDEIAFLRGLVRVALDAKLVDAQLATQAALAGAADRVAKRAMWIAFAGVVVGLIGAAEALR